jgi:hypothetical protein
MSSPNLNSGGKSMNADEYIDSLYSKDDPILDHVLESIIASFNNNDLCIYDKNDIWR